jgi:hypothetical protein
MVKKKLVEELISDGDTLLQRLDEQGFQVETMFWVDLPDQDYWRLVIASPLVGEQGATACYRKLGELLRGSNFSGITLEDITLVDPVSQEFRYLISLASDSSRLAVGASWVVFEDAIVYRWTGTSISGELTRDVTLGDLKDVWEAERRLANEPVLLIGLHQRRVTLRLHPQHGERGVEDLKRGFLMALHRRHPDCDIVWKD